VQGGAHAGERDAFPGSSELNSARRQARESLSRVAASAAGCARMSAQYGPSRHTYDPLPSSFRRVAADARLLSSRPVLPGIQNARERSPKLSGGGLASCGRRLTPMHMHT